MRLVRKVEWAVPVMLWLLKLLLVDMGHDDHDDLSAFAVAVGVAEQLSDKRQIGEQILQRQTFFIPAGAAQQVDGNDCGDRWCCRGTGL